MRHRYHPAFLLGLAIFSLLLLLAVVFYLERIGHIDMSFQTFLILKSGLPEIQSQRFGAVATQVWPWMAQSLGLPLRGVLLAYSIGHVVWPALLFGWCCWLRQWSWAMVLLLVVTGMPTQTFYWLSEMPQGLVFLVALFAWMSARGSLSNIRWWHWPLWLAAVVTAFYFHPMVLYAAIFAAAFFIIRPLYSNTYKENKAAETSPFFQQEWPVYATMLLLFGLTAFTKFKLLKLDWYDAIALKRTEAFGQLWPHWFDIQSNRDLLKYCLSDYWFVPLALAVSVAFYTWKKRWLQAALVAAYPLGFVLLVNVPYHESTHQFYMENLWLPLGLFAAIPLVFDVLPGLVTEKWRLIIVGSIALLGIVRIGRAHESWTARLDWERRFLQETAHLPNKKLLLTEQQVPMDTFKLSWGMPHEFLLLSSLESPDSARCILVTNEPQRYDSTLMANPRLFLGSFKNYGFEALPTRYFDFKDTSGYVRWGK